MTSTTQSSCTQHSNGLLGTANPLAVFRTDQADSLRFQLVSKLARSVSGGDPQILSSASYMNAVPSKFAAAPTGLLSLRDATGHKAAGAHVYTKLASNSGVQTGDKSWRWSE